MFFEALSNKIEILNTENVMLTSTYKETWKTSIITVEGCIYRFYRIFIMCRFIASI